MRVDAAKPWNQGALDKSRLDLYCSRQLRLRETMRRLDVPALLILDPIDIFYATGARNMLFFSMRTPARYLLLFAEGPAFLYEYFGCEHLAADLPTIDHIVPAEGLCHTSSGGDVQGASKRFASQILAAVGSIDPTIRTLAIDRFPLSAIDALRASGFALTHSDRVLQEARMIKTALEIPYMREAMRRVEAAVRQMEQSLEPGRTEAEAWADYHHKFMATEGQYVATRLFQTGSRTFPYFQECGDRIMENGDLVCLDTDALGYEGYAVDFSRSFVCGDATPTPSQRKLYSLAREQLETNAAALAPGIPYEELADLAWPIPEGYQESRYYCVGHGLGVSGEFPNIPHKVSGKPYPLSGTIEPGMVICLESYVGCRQAGEGIKLENQYLIHEKGVEQMSIYPFDQRLGV